jgi:hypothetical protein
MMANVELLYRVLVKDENGKVVKKTKWRKSRSFVIAYMQHMQLLMNTVNVAMIDTGNVSRTVMHPYQAAFTQHPILDVNAGDNADTFGLVVGTGTTAPTNTDYALATQIAHGTGAGQLDYGAHSFTAPAVVAGNIDFIISRSFYNGSGATITVREIGIYCMSTDTGTALRYFCVVRDVLASSVDVLATQTLTVQYTLRTTV